MTTQSDPKIRLFIAVSAFAVLLGVLVASKAFKPYFISRESYGIGASSPQPAPKESKAAPVPVNNWNPGEDHPIVSPTDFYVESEVPEVQLNEKLAYTDEQVGHAAILLTMILHDGDLLASQCLNHIRDIVTDEQLLKAKLLTKQYDAQLKDIRRQRAAVLEQVGVTIADPEEDLTLIRIKAFHLFSEARTRILQEVFTREQREQVFEKYRDQRDRAQRSLEAREAAEEKTKDANKAPTSKN